jgi:hypothetical protein
MSADEKQRISGEVPRGEFKNSVLPTINPAAEKLQQAQKPAIHPALYVA